MKMTIAMMALIGGVGIAGYMYLKKHPEMIKMMKKTNNDVYDMLNESVKK